MGANDPPLVFTAPSFQCSSRAVKPASGVPSMGSVIATLTMSLAASRLTSVSSNWFSLRSLTQPAIELLTVPDEYEKL